MLCQTELETFPVPAKQEACTSALAFATTTASLALDDCAYAPKLNTKANKSENNLVMIV